MRKILIVCAILLLFFAGYVGAQPNYQVDVAGDPDKDYITETTIAPGQQISLEIYLADAVAPQYAGGVWIDFSDSTDLIAYVSAGRALTDGSEGVTGPWDPAGGVIVNEPEGSGTLLWQIINLGGAIPDEDGDTIIGRVTLQCTSSGDANIAITTIPGVVTWTPIDDSIVLPGSLVIHQVCECQNDEDCHDGLWCNGRATCTECVCSPAVLSPCDDGNECSFDQCNEADPHCGSDMNCEEVGGSCLYYCAYCAGYIPGPTSPCMLDPECYSFDPMYGDGDSILLDGDSSGIIGDNPCTGGETENCDDNCKCHANSDQADQGDSDGVGDVCDNCPTTPNGPYGGTCTQGALGASCMSDSACGIGGICSMDQEDTDQDSWGDVCDPDDDNDVIPDSVDNCLFLANPDQVDSDEDDAGDMCDNCPNTTNPNQENADEDTLGDLCDNCPTNTNPEQEDTYPPGGNKIGDACDCEADFDCSGGVDATDVTSFLTDFGRNQFNDPCTTSSPCNGDINCDTNVDATDVTKFLEDFGRNQFNNPCPACVVGDWCVYP